MDLEGVIQRQNRTMIAFDLALGTGALLAPDATLRLLGHAQPSDDARELFRRLGPIWLTFSAAHAIAAGRGERSDWWALAWLRGTEVFTDAVWARSPAFKTNRARLALLGAGAGNLWMALGYGWLGRRRRRWPRRRRRSVFA
jgi:hypothetical protein